MFVVFEGPSKGGKTTVIKKVKYKLRERGHQCVQFKGPGQIAIPENWKTYNRYMHAVLKRFEELNPDTIILGDRAFTEAAMTNDDELLRRYRCYKEVKVIFVTAKKHKLRERGSADIFPDISPDYDKIKKIFPHIEIDTTKISEDEAARQAVKYILGDENV